MAQYSIYVKQPERECIINADRFKAVQCISAYGTSLKLIFERDDEKTHQTKKKALNNVLEFSVGYSVVLDKKKGTIKHDEDGIHIDYGDFDVDYDYDDDL